MSNILIFGDSISYGAFDLEKGGWVERLKIYLFAKFLDKEINLTTVYNFGISGDTLEGILKRLDPNMDSIYSKTVSVVFAIGMNDSVIFEDEENMCSKKAFAEYLEQLINRTQKQTGEIYFLGLDTIIEKLTNPFRDSNWYYKNHRIEEFNKIIQEAAKKNKCTFIPMQGLLVEGDLADGLHPNARGHEKIFLRVKEYLGL